MRRLVSTLLLAVVVLGAGCDRDPTTQEMLADSMPRSEFALSFFRAILGRGTELGSTREWSKLYVRYGLWDLDADGAAMMILLLGHNMLRRRHAGGPVRALLFYPFWAAVTLICHPIAAVRMALHARRWMKLARSRTLRPMPP